MAFYTYLWLRDNGTPYYVGKGSLRRATYSDGHRVRRPKNNHYIILQEWDCEEDALEAEKLLIAIYGRIDLGTGCLANLTDGGEGVSGLPVESRQRISRSLRGNLNGIGNRGGGRRKGFTVTSEHLEKMRASILRSFADGSRVAWNKKEGENRYPSGRLKYTCQRKLN